MQIAISCSRRRLLLGLTCMPAIILPGCGGGKDNYESVDLDAAYDAVTKGMSYTYVRSIVGQDPVTSIANGGNQLYHWETGRNTYLFTTLTIEINEELGVLTKTITGPNGNKSESYRS